MTLLDHRIAPRSVSRYPRRSDALYLQYYKTAADSLAADTTSLGFFDAKRNYELVEASFIPHDVLTADNTDFATLALKISTTTLASFTTEITGSGDFVANTPIDLTLGSDLEVDSGDVLLFTIAKAASGVVVPAGILDLTLVER